MKKAIIYSLCIAVIFVVVYYALKPEIQYLTIEGRLFCLNHYYESRKDLPQNWYPCSSKNYDSNGEFYFNTDDRISPISDSLCLKYECHIYLEDGYLQKIFLVPIDDEQKLFISNIDSLYELTVTDNFKPTILVQKNGTNIYLNNGPSGSVEISVDRY